MKHETEGVEYQQSTEKTPRALLTAYGLTSIWMLLVAAFAWHKLPALSEAKPSEIGDFAAGVAAPLAFLWLAVAVFLQKEELSLQREELRESRRAQQKLALETSEAVNVSRQALSHQLSRAEDAELMSEVKSLIAQIAAGTHGLSYFVGEEEHLFLGEVDEGQDPGVTFGLILDALLNWQLQQPGARVGPGTIVQRMWISQLRRHILFIFENLKHVPPGPNLAWRIENWNLRLVEGLLGEVEAWLDDSLRPANAPSSPP